MIEFSYKIIPSFFALRSPKYLIMKVFITSLLLFSISYGYAQQPDFKALKKSLAELNESLYISKYEVSNGDYKKFRNYLIKSSNTTALKITVVDTLFWRSKTAYNEPYVKHYYQHEAYQVYPVVAISYKAATAYCSWLSEQYNQNKKRKFEKVNFRLPTKEEWVTAVQAGNKEAIYPWEGDSVFRENGASRANFKRSKEQIKVVQYTSEADILAPVESYWPNKLGIYNLSGNAAEMLLTEGTTAGGGWINTSEYLSINAKDPFKENFAPNTAIGFRWVMEVIEP